MIGTAARPGRLAAVVVVAAVSVPVALSLPSGPPPVAASQETGQELFQANCAVCHGPSAQGTRAAPALGGVLDRLGPDGAERTIREGRRGMPSFDDQLTDAEIEALIAYLGTLPAASPAPRGPGRRGPMTEGMRERMMWDGMMGGWGWPLLLVWVLFSLVLVTLVVLGVVWLGRNLGADRGPRSPGAPDGDRPGAAREALDLRYARGEIGREEYLQARRDLEGRGG